MSTLIIVKFVSTFGVARKWPLHSTAPAEQDEHAAESAIPPVAPCRAARDLVVGHPGGDQPGDLLLQPVRPPADDRHEGLREKAAAKGQA